MDCYALSIQEILKTYGISPNGSKKEVWDSFSENMHQLMSPLLSSRYFFYMIHYVYNTFVVIIVTKLISFLFKGTHWPIHHSQRKFILYSDRCTPLRFWNGHTSKSRFSYASGGFMLI